MPFLRKESKPLRSHPGGGGGGGGGRDFVKNGYFFVPRYEVYRGENPLTIHEIYAALTPSDS